MDVPGFTGCARDGSNFSRRFAPISWIHRKGNGGAERHNAGEGGVTEFRVPPQVGTGNFIPDVERPKVCGFPFAHGAFVQSFDRFAEPVDHAFGLTGFATISAFQSGGVAATVGSAMQVVNILAARQFEAKIIERAFRFEIEIDVDETDGHEREG